MIILCVGFVYVFFKTITLLGHILETYTGMKAYSTDRADKKLVSVCVCDTTQLGNYVS